jgi:hypothetical protein
MKRYLFSMSVVVLFAVGWGAYVDLPKGEYGWFVFRIFFCAVFAHLVICRRFSKNKRHRAD